MGRNIILAAGKKKGGVFHPGFHEVVKQYYDPKTANLSSAAEANEIAKNIAHGVTGLYLDRSNRQRLTGKWIIFAEHDGKNYYLCLAEHDEGNDVIAKRIKSGCREEFPFLP